MLEHFENWHALGVVLPWFRPDEPAVQFRKVGDNHVPLAKCRLAIVFIGEFGERRRVHMLQGWDTVAEDMAAQITEGCEVEVRGYADPGRWRDKDGNYRNSPVCVIKEFKVVSKPVSEPSGPPAGPPDIPAPGAAEDDGLPF